MSEYGEHVSDEMLLQRTADLPAVVALLAANDSYFLRISAEAALED